LFLSSPKCYGKKWGRGKSEGRARKSKRKVATRGGKSGRVQRRKKGAVDLRFRGKRTTERGEYKKR